MISSTEDNSRGSEYYHFDESNLTNQPCDLPDPETLELPRFGNTLCGPEDFDDWLKELTTNLKELDLLGLIDPTTPPPRLNSEAGRRWFLLSTKMTKWLLHTTIASELLNRLNIMENNIVLLDRLLARVKNVLQIHGSALDALRLKKFHENTDQVAFGDTKRYVESYWHEFNILRDNNMMPSPYTSLLDILQGVQKLDWFVSASMYTMLDLDLQVFQKTNPTGTFAELVDYDMFQKYVVMILELLVEKDAHIFRGEK
ncbi:uncharacterized protein N7483_003790 [Penicillium malachiteum]|uniref:uncharacterized protein n=1 Tax=Penicillium malachiteum TaxID=1324776 RepID=UPI00254750B5|nr:uncharacterized protein N7483_003790 [Penicillium malachiteum]KAJ5729282.1 hypothetical protein N7483_003790 [Penicillium malachiteum]